MGIEFLISTLLGLFGSSILFTWKAYQVLDEIKDSVTHVQNEHRYVKSKVAELYNKNKNRTLTNAHAIESIIQELNGLYEGLHRNNVDVRPVRIQGLTIITSPPDEDDDLSSFSPSHFD